jgi:hypothetical protein
MKRALMSDVLPGEPVMMRMGRVGYSCAIATADAIAMQAAPIAHASRREGGSA